MYLYKWYFSILHFRNLVYIFEGRWLSQNGISFEAFLKYFYFWNFETKSKTLNFQIINFNRLFSHTIGMAKTGMRKNRNRFGPTLSKISKFEMLEFVKLLPLFRKTFRFPVRSLGSFSTIWTPLYFSMYGWTIFAHY